MKQDWKWIRANGTLFVHITARVVAAAATRTFLAFPQKQNCRDGSWWMQEKVSFSGRFLIFFYFKSFLLQAWLFPLNSISRVCNYLSVWLAILHYEKSFKTFPSGKSNSPLKILSARSHLTALPTFAAIAYKKSTEKPSDACLSWLLVSF